MKDTIAQEFLDKQIEQAREERRLVDENTHLGPEIYDLLPIHDRDTMQMYIEHHLQPGHFLEAVLAGDLFGAAAYADRYNQPLIAAIAKWVYEYAPTDCYGSVGRVESWLGL